MDTVYWHTVGRHTLPSGYEPAPGYHPRMHNSIPLSQIPGSPRHSSSHSEISKSHLNFRQTGFPHPTYRFRTHSMHGQNKPPFYRHRNIPDFLHLRNQIVCSYLPLFFYDIWCLIILKQAAAFAAAYCFMRVLCLLFYSSCNTFCKLLLENEENNHRRNRAEKNPYHQHSVVRCISGRQV